MKTLTALVLVTLFGFGCSSATIAVKEKLGIPKREQLVARVKDARDGQQEAKQQFASALDEFLADIRVEERHYVREHRVLFAHKKSLIVQERIFFRNIPISSWVDHEIPVEEGADIDSLAKTLSVFNNAIEGGVSGSRGPRQVPFGAGSIGPRSRLG